MGEFFGAEPLKSLFTGGVIAAILLLLTKVLERTVPSTDARAGSERSFRTDLLARVLLLEQEGRTLQKESDAQDQKYYELYTKHELLKQEFHNLSLKYEALVVKFTALELKAGGV